MEKTNEKQLIEIGEQYKLPKNILDTLLTSFQPFFNEARPLIEEAKKIKVESADDKDVMAKSKELRAKLRDIRGKAEEKRVEIKDQSLRESRAIDGMSNIFKALIVPVEKYLEQQEKFVELKEQFERQEKYSRRVSEMAKYVDDPSMYKLEDMSDAAFDMILADAIKGHGARIAAEKAADIERKLEEEKQAIHHTRYMALMPYKDFLEGFTLSTETFEVEFQKQLTLGKKRKHEYEARQEEIRKENEELRQEQIKSQKKLEKAEAKLKAQKEKQKKEQLKKLKEEKELRDAEVADKKKKEMAPDKDKIIEFSNIFTDIEFPTVTSPEAHKVLSDIKSDIAVILQRIKDFQSL